MILTIKLHPEVLGDMFEELQDTIQTALTIIGKQYTFCYNSFEVKKISPQDAYYFVRLQFDVERKLHKNGLTISLN